MAHLQLFLSAVSKEFAPYRADMSNLLDRHDLTVKVQEDFFAGGGPTLEKLDDYIKNCEAVIHLAGDMTGEVTHRECIAAMLARYPDLPERLPAIADGLDPSAPVFTYTQWEAYLALYHSGCKLFIAVPAQNAKRDNRYLRDDAQAAAQAAHLGRLAALNRHPEITFRNADELTAQLYKSSILDLLKTAGLPPLRRINTRKMPTTFARRLYGRGEEMARLHTAWDSGAEGPARADKTNMAIIDAMGGAGKTALIKFFTDELAADGWRGADAAYVWSFYSQGTDEKRQGSADEFFSDALNWFGYDGEIADLKSQHAKGEALAELVRARRTLLILDGLEPLQYGPPRQSDGKDATGLTGGLKDQGIATLLAALALENPGLALVTTRLAIPDLADTAAPRLQTMALYHVSRLPPERLARERAALIAAGKATTPEALRDALVAREREIAGRIRRREDDLPDEALATAPAVELLAVLGVEGTPRELFDLADDLDGHALALNLFGKFLVKFHRGDVRRRDLLPSADEMHAALGANTRERERNPFKVMRSYEIQFEQQIAEQLGHGAIWTRWSRLKDLAGMGGRQLSARALATPAGKQLALLQILGLFDRPVEREVIDHLLGGEAIPDLTDGPGAASRDDWTKALVALRDLALVLPEDSGAPDQVDAHPLVREYFGARLEREKPEAWRAAHGRLYEHYKTLGLPPAFLAPEAYGVLALASAFPDAPIGQTIEGTIAGQLTEEVLERLPPSIRNGRPEKLREAAKLIGTQAFEAAKKRFQPDSEAGMAPLFAAIAHGCAAGRYDETFQEVYWPRIPRGNEGYAVHKLGLFGSELAAVAQFFEQPFSAPAGKSAARPGGLPESDQALVLNLAGFRLRALGRLREALAPFEADTAMSVEQKDWKNAAIGADNLSALQLVLGDGADARTSAEDSVRYADKSGDAFWRMACRTTLADALFHAGEADAAAARFAEAETLQAEMQPDLPRLYSLQGYRYCDLLLARGRAGEVLRRAEYAIRTAQRNNWLLDIALDTLSLARAHAALARAAKADGDTHRDKARARLDAAVDGLRNAGATEFLARGLLARAAVHRRTDEPKAARDDLRATLDAARRSEMRLFLIDAHIEEALQWLTPPGVPAARPSFKACASARAALDAARDLIAETGLKRREADLALARARLALAERAPDTARVALQDAIALIGDKGWWGLLPGLAELVDAGGFGELRPDLDRLHAAAAAADHRKAGAAWHVHNAYAQALQRRAQQSRAQPASPDLTDAQIDELLAREDFRTDLRQILDANGHDLDTLTPEQQRQAAREFLAHLAQQQAAQQSSGTPEPSDAQLDQMLANPEVRAKLAEILKANNIDTPLDDMPPEAQRNILRQVLAAQSKDQ